MRAGQIQRTRALTGGRGGRTWRIDVGGESFVLHRRGGGAGRRLAAEVVATGAAASIGVGPPVVAADEEAGLLLSRWIPGQAASAPVLASTSLEATVRSLRSLHSITDVDGVDLADLLPVVDPLASRAHYLARLVDEPAPSARGTRSAALRFERHDEIDEIATLLARSTATRSRVLIHGDPVPGNVIVAADAVRLVDFEYAGFGDAGYELGHLAASVHLDRLTIERVVRVYREGDTDTDTDADADADAAAVEGWSYVAAQAWIAWVLLEAELGARGPRWQRWAERASERLADASRSGRLAQVAAALRASDG